MPAFVLLCWMYQSAARVARNQQAGQPIKKPRAKNAGNKMDLNDFKSDLDKVEDGVWVDFGPETKILICAWNNEAHQRFLKNVYKRHKKQIDLNLMTDDQAAEVMADQWQHIIKGWEGIEIDGEALQYSPRTVCDLARNVQYKKFFDSLEDIAKDHSLYKAEVAEEVGKT